MSTKEAMMFPVIASVTLFGIYMVFQVSRCALFTFSSRRSFMSHPPVGILLLFRSFPRSTSISFWLSTSSCSASSLSPECSCKSLPSFEPLDSAVYLVNVSFSLFRTFVSKVWPHSLISNEHYELEFVFKRGTVDNKKSK